LLQIIKESTSTILFIFVITYFFTNIKLWKENTSRELVTVFTREEPDATSDTLLTIELRYCVPI